MSQSRGEPFSTESATQHRRNGKVCPPHLSANSFLPSARGEREKPHFALAALHLPSVTGFSLSCFGLSLRTFSRLHLSPRPSSRGFLTTSLQRPMSPTSPRPDLERRGSSEKVKSFVRRFSLPRRESIDKKTAALQKAGRRGSKSPVSTPTSPLSPLSPAAATEGRLPTIPPSPSTSTSDISSWGQTQQLICSSS